MQINTPTSSIWFQLRFALVVILSWFPSCVCEYHLIFERLVVRSSSHKNCMLCSLVSYSQCYSWPMLFPMLLLQFSDHYESLKFFSRCNLSCSNVWRDFNGKAKCWYRKICLKLLSELQVLVTLKSSLYLLFLFVFSFIHIFCLNHAFVKL